MKVCYFGIYDPNYPRNKTLIRGLRQNGVEVIECNSRAKGLAKYWQLYKKHREIKDSYDILVVGFLGQLAVFLAKIISRKKIVLDVFVSLYNTNVFDRKLYSAGSFRGKLDFFLDKYACKISDLNLLDTQAQIDYFVNTFRLNRNKFCRVFVGADDEFYKPHVINKELDNRFVVHFHGYLVPFHGIEYIIAAAEILKREGIIWQIVTRFDKQYERAKIKIDSLGLNNFIFYKVVPPLELNNFINQADICLGVFGNSPKKDLVIPNKIFEALACKKPIITAESPAVREILVNRVNCLLVKSADPVDLAEKIMELKSDHNLKKSIEENGYQLYQENFSSKILGQKLLAILQNIK